MTTPDVLLLDVNVLIAIVVEDHVHHHRAESWVGITEGRFATCPITQGGLVRMLVRSGARGEDAIRTVERLVAHPRHEFWADDVSFEHVDLGSVVGHRQVTDAYLAQLARSRGGQLATLDAGLVAEHPDVAVLVPEAP
jgi:uncharacterized protein